MPDVIEFQVNSSSPPQAKQGQDAAGKVVALPSVDLDTVIEMVDCLRGLGMYRQDRIRETRMAETDQAEQVV